MHSLDHDDLSIIQAGESGPHATRHAHFSAQKLEISLGDPEQADSPLSFAGTIALDEQDAFPQEHVDWLKQWKFFDYLVPAEYGGRLQHLEQLLQLARITSRRDLTTSIAIGQTFLGALPVWLVGNPQQATALAAHIRQAGLGCLALTEREHGSDLTHIETRASRSGTDYQLQGTKWLINNATRGITQSLLARTGNGTGPGQLSLLFLEKPRLNGRYSNLAKIRTHGIRGADISGICFEDCRIPVDCLLGKEGDGFDITLRTLQISRILCAGFSLGAADTALRLAAQFALERQLYGQTVADLEPVKAQLLTAWLDLIISESMALSSMRAAHTLPKQISLYSAITKYFVPMMAENIVSLCGRVLGARHYLREDYASGIYQKLMRDNQVVSLFDGSTAVNLSIIAGQLNQLSGHHLKAQNEHDADLLPRLHPLFDNRQPMPDTKFVRAEQLALSNDGINDILQSLHHMSAIVRTARELEPVVLQNLLKLINELLVQYDDIDNQIDALNHQGQFKPLSESRFYLAERYCQLHAAACCLQMWQHNREHGSEWLKQAHWLVLALQLIVSRFQQRHAGLTHSQPMFDKTWSVFLAQTEKPLLYSLSEFHLAP